MGPRKSIASALLGFMLSAFFTSGCADAGTPGTEGSGGAAEAPAKKLPGESAPSVDKGDPAAVAPLVSAHNSFGLRLFNLAVDGAGSKNVVVSPSSVALALEMTAAGAAGETREAMAGALGLSELGVAEAGRQARSLLSTWQEAGKKIELNVANALFANQQVQFKEAFIKSAQQNFQASTKTLDFSSPEAPASINGWVDKQTRGKIKSIVDSIDARAILYLVNATYFKGTWTKPFDKDATADGDFTTGAGAVQKAAFMHRTAQMPYMKNRDFQAVRLPYADGSFSMYVFLPGKDSSLDSLRGKLTADNWQSWMDEFKDKHGHLALPRFNVEFKTNLADDLKKCGMAVAFDPNRADFSGMADSSDRISIGRVLHKTLMEVDETGTVAAAATAVEMVVTGALVPPQDSFEMVVDRPFLAAIRDEKTGSILFLAAVVEPGSAAPAGGK